MSTARLPASFSGNMRLPVISAPMFLVSNPELVLATCRAGLVGTFPALNARTTEQLNGWLQEVGSVQQQEDIAPYGVNLIVHKSNPRLQADLALCVEYRVPLVITSLGAAKEVVEAVHSYGGLVFHDVTTLRHAQKAIDAGVDGLILVCAGAGGHAGGMSAFAFIPAVRAMFDGIIVAAGGISDGKAVAAAQTLGADVAYMGTRFIATKESSASDEYKQMLLDSNADDIAYTASVSGIPASFMKKSLQDNGVDLSAAPKADIGSELAGGEAKAWKDIWSAGQGVSLIDNLPSVQELVDRLDEEYKNT